MCCKSKGMGNFKRDFHHFCQHKHKKHTETQKQFDHLQILPLRKKDTKPQLTSQFTAPSCVACFYAALLLKWGLKQKGCEREERHQKLKKKNDYIL